MTHIDRQRKLMEATQKDVQLMMRMNENQYTDCFYESGCRYLERLELEMKSDDVDVPQMWEKIKGSGHFWKWWRIQFNIKNQELILGDYLSDEQFSKAHSTTKVIISKHVMNLIFPGS